MREFEYRTHGITRGPRRARSGLRLAGVGHTPYKYNFILYPIHIHHINMSCEQDRQLNFDHRIVMRAFVSQSPLRQGRFIKLDMSKIPLEMSAVATND